MPLDPKDSSVQTYLGMLQDVIARMGNNSANCKTWCITIVSAVALVASEKGLVEVLTLALIPVLLFFYLDSHYLGLERKARKLYENFVTVVTSGTAEEKDLYKIGIHGKPGETIEAFFSISTGPFYLFLFALLYLIEVLWR